MTDPLLNEIREYRDRYGAAHKYDPRSMGRDLRSREKQSARKLAKLNVRRAAGCQ